MITFGLTGGIASGKSTVSKTFQTAGFPMVDADLIARQVVEPGTDGLRQVIDSFGEDFLNEDGTLNRIRLGALVFTNTSEMKRINSIMMPLIDNEANKQIKSWHDQGHTIVGYDAALICEKGNADKFRPLVVVSCPQEMQLQRLMKRNSLTEAEAMSRINAQMTAAQKADMADFVIDTSGSIELSVQQTEVVIYELRKLAE